MKPCYSKIVWMPVAFLLMVAMACEESKPGGGGSVTPSEEDPQILEGHVCASVFNNKPELVGTDFFPGETVYIWLSWDNVPGKHDFRVVWVKPNDDVVDSPLQSFDSTTGQQIIFASLKTTTSEQTGRWYVEVYLDDTFYASYSFWLWEIMV